MCTPRASGFGCGFGSFRHRIGQDLGCLRGSGGFSGASVGFDSADAVNVRFTTALKSAARGEVPTPIETGSTALSVYEAWRTDPEHPRTDAPPAATIRFRIGSWSRATQLACS